MSCDEILASGDDAVIRAHAATCEACRPMAMLMAAPKLALPEGAWEEHLRRRNQPRVQMPARGWMVAAAAALLMTAAAMFYGLTRTTYQPMAIMVYEVPDTSGFSDEVTE